jgi:Patatin-like phospholipase
VSGIDTDGPVDPLLPPPVVRILALSGGGYRSLFTAEVLARLEQDSKRKIRDLVDLVIGTSAGALVAAGVAAGVAASDVAAAFRTHGERIFPRRVLPAPRRLLFRAPYRSEPLGAAVEEISRGRCAFADERAQGQSLDHRREPDPRQVQALHFRAIRGRNLQGPAAARGHSRQRRGANLLPTALLR